MSRYSNDGSGGLGLCDILTIVFIRCINRDDDKVNL